MITHEKASACLEEESAKLKQMSYEELEMFARSHGMLGTWKSRELEIDGERIDLNTMICKLGHIHKRISVEMILSDESNLLPANIRGLYFERFESGRFYPTSKEQARESTIFKSLPYAFIGIIVFGLLVLLGYLFLQRA